MTLRQAKWIVGKWIVEMFQRRQHDYRLIDGCFYKNSEVHVSRRCFKGVNMIIGRYMVASTKTLKFMSAGVFQTKTNFCPRRKKLPYFDDVQ